jgi:ribosomal-protein-alanine N-acetyltransferase
MLRFGSGRARQDAGVAPATDRAAVEVIPMRRRHLKAVIAIEQRAFPSPWSLALYLSELAQPTTRVYLVARVGTEVVGYAGMLLIVDEGHVTTVGVAPDWQRHGVGRRLMLALVREARKRGARQLTLEVRFTNLGAQELYRQFGFAPAGIRKDYYAEVHEDALIMWAHDVDTDAYGDRLDAIEAGLGRASEEGGDR